MKNYVKPVVLSNDELAEGVYAASGVGSECYYPTAYIHMTPEAGRDNYCIQANTVHNAVDGHHSTEQVLTIYFNQPVTFEWCSSSNAVYTSGNGTAALVLTYNYHANANENFGLGDIYVKSEDGLTVTGAKLTCNYSCEQHEI